MTAGEEKALRKLVESKDWDLYNKAVDDLIKDVHKYIERVDTKIVPTVYAERIKNAVRLITAFEAIKENITGIVFRDKAKKTVEDVLESFDPYNKENK